MDYEDELQIAEEFPDEIPHILHSQPSNKLSSPINSANRFFEAFPSDFKRRIGITHFQNTENKIKVSLVTPKNVDTSSEQSKVRSIKEFLEFQKSFADERERKIEKMKEEREKEEAEECKNTPTINSHSRRLTSHLESTCYQRLSRQKPIEPIPPETEFHPKILNKSKSMNRKQKVSELLYDDAQRRIQKQKVIKQQMNINSRPRINTNTDKLVAKTLKLQYSQLVKDIQHVDQQQVLAILNQLFNTNFTLHQSNEYSEKCQRLITYLFKGRKQRISLKRLWSFIEISTGCKQSNSTFSDKEERQILKEFKHFLYRNRMHKERTKTYENEPTFRPEILKNSERLAQRKRDRMLTQAEEILERQNIKINVNDSYQLPIADLYILERMHNQEENRLRKEVESQKEFQQCTFRPRLTKWNGVKEADIAPITTKSSRARESLNKKPQQTMNENTLMTSNTMESLEYLHTHTNQRKRSDSRSSMNRSFKQIKNLESSVFRMSAGRKEKQFKNKFQQRGYPKDIENWEKFRIGEKRAIESNSKELKGYQCNTRKESQSGFIFDIYISNGVLETIHLDKDEDIITRVEELQYKYGLNQQKKIKLVQMIKSHLCSYLQKEKENRYI